MKISVPKNGLRLQAQEVTAAWEKIEKYQMPFSEEYLQYKHGWSLEFCSAALNEYRRFIFLALVSDAEITPSEPIDEVWHLHILHTRAYEAFGKLCGRFIHHGPGLPTERVRWSRQYGVTFDLYRSIFNCEPPTDFWPSGKPKIPKEPVRQPRIADVLALFNRGCRA